MRGITGAAVAAGSLVLGTPASSDAGGFEVPEIGSVALGRAGAFVARASDPSALATNVAGIVALPGFQVTLGSSFSLVSQCFTRSGRYDGPWNGTQVGVSGTVFSDGPGAYHTAGAAYPRICNEPEIGALPQLLATYRLGETFAVGLGVYPPNAIPTKRFPTMVAASVPGSGEAGEAVSAPAPQRYMLVYSHGSILYPTIAVAWAPLRWLRVGGAFQPSFARIHAVTFANAAAGQSPSADAVVDLKVHGVFFAGNLGVQIIPLPSWSFGAHVHLSQSPQLRGTAALTLNPYAADPDTKIAFGAPDNAEVDFGLPPVQARIGARYARSRPGAVLQTDSEPGKAYDPMRDDVFDVEVDLIYEAGSANQYFHVINSKPDADYNYARSTCPNALPAGAGITTDACFPRYWKDVFGVRLGGDYNVTPDFLALRAGASFETGAQSTRGANLDALGHDTLGIHAGATLRPTPWLSIHAAYAHYFMSDIDAVDGELATVTLGGTAKPEQCAQARVGQGACTGNQGLYQSRLDMFNIGATARF